MIEKDDLLADLREQEQVFLDAARAVMARAQPEDEERYRADVQLAKVLRQKMYEVIAEIHAINTATKRG